MEKTRPLTPNFPAVTMSQPIIIIFQSTITKYSHISNFPGLHQISLTCKMLGVLFLAKLCRPNFSVNGLTGYLLTGLKYTNFELFLSYFFYKKRVDKIEFSKIIIRRYAFQKMS